MRCVTCVELHLFTRERFLWLDPYLRTNKRKIGLTALRDERGAEEEEEEETEEKQPREREMRGEAGQSCVIEFTFVRRSGSGAI